ncbi:MAG: hypothetical protein K0S32_3955 [Bacteroidetes bacterium]|jgi:hypothetical protein|nr:hypothetical protein [Bacteroidota bacterium]
MWSFCKPDTRKSDLFNDTIEVNFSHKLLIYKEALKEQKLRVCLIIPYKVSKGFKQLDLKRYNGNRPDVEIVKLVLKKHGFK